MDLNAQKEQFSLAYLRVIAAVAGYACYVPSVDDDSTDVGIAEKGGGGTMRSPRLEAQIKCHAALTPDGEHLSYRLKMKNYDELRVTDVHVPRILIVVIVPEDLSEWLDCREAELVIRRCAYWISLKGRDEVIRSAEDPRVTVQLPKTQTFTPNSLRTLMTRVGSGESL